MTIDNARLVLEPLLFDYVQTFNAGNFDRMAAFYHKNSVMVEKDKSVLWGQKGEFIYSGLATRNGNCLRENTDGGM
ncbi:hypothetical protein ANCCAN_24423 [Ancylostoma caninum]|uniref:NTF2 domain-containing protein n=1 Tax=Ancylostoma caninum TaxID=29170 RepID=A0A368FCL2_ANCCA|nr:hypothetical protein ANCCAN_24423 [Ancylostoma caninum]